MHHAHKLPRSSKGKSGVCRLGWKFSDCMQIGSEVGAVSPLSVGAHSLIDSVFHHAGHDGAANGTTRGPPVCHCFFLGR